ncbi:hypothetical protein ACNFH5_22325 [Pseudomonas sp. NY15435]|uniref:hypothetical protein n=1 Tax=Pseudomonas sp. NY15435 TaxID=3400358 RepID=UPI003A858554
MKALLTVVAIGLFAMGLPALADTQTIPVHFNKGSSSTTVNGTLKGGKIIDYVLRAKEGQTMSVVFKPSNNAAYVNVLPPDSTGAAIFIGSIDGNEWTGTLPSSGDYRVRTYLVGSAAKRNESSNYTLTISITSSNNSNSRASHSERAGQGVFDARGTIPCAQGEGQPMRTCSFGVARDSGGDASVKITFPDGHSRFISFANGQATGADLSQADGDMSFSATKEADLYKVQAGHERFEIPEAVIFGG